MRGPALRVRDGVVHIAVVGRVVTAGPAARQVAAAHEIGQRLGGGVAGFGWTVAGMGQRHQFRGAGQLGDQLRRDEAVSGHLGPRLGPAAIQGGLLGDHMKHHRRRRPARPGRTVGSATPAAQPVSAGSQSAQGVGAALIAGPGVVPADRGRQRIQSFVQGHPVGLQQGARQLAQPVGAHADIDLTVGLVLDALADRVAVGFDHDLVDSTGEPAAAHRGPARHIRGQL